MSPLAAVNLNVPVEAVIGAWSAIPRSAASVRVFALLHETGAATVMMPPDGAAASDDVATVTFPRPNSFSRSAADNVEVGFAAVTVNGAEPGRITSALDGPVWMVMSLGSSNSVPATPD